MFKFFALTKQKKGNINTSVIENKLDQLIELLQQQQQTDEEKKNIHVENVHINHLENIIFRLDNIEIDELSGRLIIGNNIMATEDLAASVVQKLDKESAKKEARSESSPPKLKNLVKTAKGYQFRNK